MKGIFIGDLHCQYSNLEDTKLLFERIKAIKKENEDVNKYIFLGDIFHTHDVLRVGLACEIQKLFKSLEEPKENIIVLVGNHDFTKPNASEIYNSVRLVLENIATVVDSPLVIDEFSFVPFMGDNEEFVKVCNELPENKILVCHQTFDSAVYENNFTAPGGVDQNRLKQRVIISGHIHKRQYLKNDKNIVIYIGTPRQLTASEANEAKYVSIYDQSGERFHFDVTNVCKRFIFMEIDQDSMNEIVELNENWNENKDDVRIKVTGTKDFYLQIIKDYSHLKNVKFIPNIKKTFDKKIDIESSGNSIDEALYKYVHEVYDINDTLKDEVWKKLQSKIPQLGNKI